MGRRRMKYQTNPPLGKFVNKWGCLFCSVLQKVEKSSLRHGKFFKFSNEDVLSVYERAKQIGIVQKEVFSEDGSPLDGCSVYNGKALFNLCAAMFNLPVFCESYRQAEAEYAPSEDEEEILELRRDGKDGSHFVSGTGIAGALPRIIEFDPIEGGSNSARTGWVESKRILVIKKA